MKITLTKEESINLFFDALCNGLSTITQYDLELKYDSKEYHNSRLKLNEPCFEDVLMQMLKDGYKLNILDIGYNGEYNRSITIQDVYDRVHNTQLNHLMDAINEEGDATTAEVILQTVFFNEIIFG